MIGPTETLKLSDKTTVEVGIMDGDEIDSAEIIASGRVGSADRDGNLPIIAYGVISSRVYAACSVRKINGEEVTPLRNEAEYRKLAKRLVNPELIVLSNWARQHYSPSEAEVKNEPGAPDSSAE